MGDEHVIRLNWDELGNIPESNSESPLLAESDNTSPKDSPTLKASKNKSNDMLASIQKVGSVYAFGRQVAQMGLNYVSNKYQIQGENLKSKRANVNFGNAMNNASVGLGALTSVATGNPIAIALTAYSLAQRAYNLALDTQKYNAQLANDRFKSQYYSSRLVQITSEVR